MGKVADLEKAKNEAHTMAHEDIFCGVDKWYDNHFAYDQRSSSLDSFKSSFDENGRIYHIFGSCSSSSMTNMYVVDPTGEAIQLDGSWTSCPSGGLVMPFKTLAVRERAPVTRRRRAVRRSWTPCVLP